MEERSQEKLELHTLMVAWISCFDEDSTQTSTSFFQRSHNPPAYPIDFVVKEPSKGRS